MSIRARLPIALAALALAPIWGCAGAEATQPDLIPAKGKVTYKGKPLTTGVVTFEPRDFGRPATGELQADGTFTLGTLKPDNGVVAGKHRVFVTGTAGPGKVKEIIPLKYSQANTSGLTAEVGPEKTEFTFDLK